MGDWKVGRPGSGRGNEFKSKNHEDHLLVFIGVTEAPDQKTPYGEADGAHCDYVVCLTEEAVFADAMVWGTALVPALVEGAAEVEVVIGHVTKGEAKPGQSPPWLLGDPTEEEERAVTSWLDAHAVRMPSGAIVVEAPRAPAPASDESF